jgi:outer membrane protein with beta-barrel domain
MKRLFSIFLLTTTISISAFAENYGGRAEVFVSAFGLLTHQTNGNAISADATKAGGGSAGYRFQLNRSSALEGRYGFSRNSQKYTIGSAVYSVPVYVSEISGSYVYKFSNEHGFRPFLEGGGGVMLFSPGNYGGGTGSVASGTPANNFGYPASAFALTSDTNSDTIVPAYNGSTASLPRQAKGMLVYGAGVDVPASSHLSLRLEFRAAGYKVPDFGATALHTNTFTFAYEPSVGLAYRF